MFSAFDCTEDVLTCDRSIASRAWVQAELVRRLVVGMARLMILMLGVVILVVSVHPVFVRSRLANIVDQSDYNPQSTRGTATSGTGGGLGADDTYGDSSNTGGKSTGQDDEYGMGSGRSR